MELNKLRQNPRLLLAWALAGFALFVALLALSFARLPAESIERLSTARLAPLLTGCGFLAAAFVFRAVRLNRLLPEGRHLSLWRGTVVSAAANVLYNVVPFRLGEVAALGLYRRETRGSWGESAGLIVLIKVVDISTAILSGVCGALWLLAEGQTVLARTAPLVLGLAGAAALAALPYLGLGLIRRLSGRVGKGSRLERLLASVADGLELARKAPKAYFASFLAGILYLTFHLTGVQFVLASLGFPVPIALVAAATVASVTFATAIPSPAGTFGSSEAGFAAALSASGIPAPTGFVLATSVHLAIVVSSALLAIPAVGYPKRSDGVP